MTNNFIVSCENAQELADLQKLRNVLEGAGYNALYFDIAPMLGSPSLDSKKLFLITHNSLAFHKPFKKLSIIGKLLAAIANALILIYVYYRSRSKFLLIGTPLLVYRIARIITFGNLKTVSLIRGVIAHSEATTSISSWVFLRIGVLARNKLLKSILSDYYSNLVLCTGAVTRDFLLSRGVPEENIKVVGSVYCDSLDISNSKKTSVAVPLIVFVSSSFAFHGYTDAQEYQTKLIAKLKKVAEQSGIAFLIRKHPRDSIEFYTKETSLLDCLDETVSDPVSSYPENTLFVSTVSTLIFEMAYAGRNACFVADDFFAHRFSAWYSAVGIEPYRDLDSLVYLYKQGASCPIGGDLANVLALKYKGNVVSQSAAEILRKVEGYNDK